MRNNKTYTYNHLKESIEITKKLNIKKIEQIIKIIKLIKKRKGRIFFLGVGGSAANCSHAVNDFRKILNIEAYSASENVAELTARINDEGWNTSYKNWLKVSNLSKKDCIFIFSVGGGNLKKKVSTNLIESIKYAKSKKSKILSIVSRDGGYAYKNSSASVLIPVVNKNAITPHAEAFQAVIWHLIVTHPTLNPNKNKWESIK
tara:strand:- start:181 stop:789 length:609 start_codon:yes stop_codon:yes gene_type:complete